MSNRLDHARAGSTSIWQVVLCRLFTSLALVLVSQSLSCTRTKPSKREATNILTDGSQSSTVGPKTETKFVRVVPGIGVADAEGKHWKIVKRGSHVVLAPASEHQDVKEILTGSPLDYWLMKSGEVAEQGQIVTSDGVVVVDLTKPKKLENVAGVVQMTAAPNPCLLRRDGRLDCFRLSIVEDRWGNTADYRRSSTVTVESEGVTALRGINDPCYAKGGQVYCTAIQSDAASQINIRKVTLNLRGVDDFCVVDGGNQPKRTVCANVSSELQCVGPWSPSAVDSEGEPLRASDGEIARPLPGVTIKHLQCRGGGPRVIDSNGALWRTTRRRAYSFLSKMTHVNSALDSFEDRGVLCVLHDNGTVSCCGRYSYDWIQVGQGEASDDNCRLELIRPDSNVSSNKQSDAAGEASTLERSLQ